jgi:hypothetical protein
MMCDEVIFRGRYLHTIEDLQSALGGDWDGARYRYLIASSPREEVCFLGVAYFGKEALDRAIDAAMAEQEAAPDAPIPHEPARTHQGGKGDGNG